MTNDQREGAKNPLLALVDFIGNLWFGVATMVAILVYCWLGSAGTQPLPFKWFPRETFEKTEMEWFTWWPFLVIVVLFSLSLTISTVRRIPFSLPNLGVWMVHVGILVLVAGALIYYALKLEGDVAVYRRAAVISVDGGPEARMLLRNGERAVVEGPELDYRVTVASLNPNYELLTGEDAGKTTYAAQLRFDPMTRDGESQAFIRQLLVDYPQYTEDVLPGQGRAIKVLDRPLVDERVEARLEYAATDALYLDNRPALYARVAGESEWTEFRLRGLPRYHEYVRTAGDAFIQPGEPAPRVGRLELVPTLAQDASHLPEDVELRVTGFLPFATMREQWVAGGDRFDPIVSFTLRMGTASISERLLANHPRANSVTVGESLQIAFRWLEDESSLAELTTPGVPRLVVSVPGEGVRQEIAAAKARAAPVAIEGTRYKVRLRDLYPNWTLARSGERAQMAVVEVISPERSFHRAVVSPQVELSQDMTAEGQMAGGLVDERIQIQVEGIRETGLIIVGGPVGSHVILSGEDGSVDAKPASVGRSVSFFDGQMTLVLHELAANARRVEKPIVIPVSQRDLRAGSAYSLVQVEVRSGPEARSEWVDFSYYPHPSRMGYSVHRVPLADRRRIELVYSREMITLPTPVALDEFRLETYPGGERERDYISLVRFREDGGWSEVEEVRSNQPTERDGWWYFQSTWDPPAPERGYAGMNYTGLGVGNRHGVFTMLFGCILTVVGSIWAFYFKPWLLRRRRELSSAQAGGA